MLGSSLDKSGARGKGLAGQERTVNNLASQHDTYLRELHKAHASLWEFHKYFTSFNLYGTTGGQVMYMSKTLEERTLTLESAKKELEILRDHMLPCLNNQENLSL